MKLLKVFASGVLFSAGVLTGLIVAPSVARTSAAQTQIQPAQQGPKVITLQSYSAGPAMGANVLLAHTLQADIAVVNGYDIMKINQEILDYLAKQPGADRKALSEIISRTRAEQIYELPRSQNNGAPK